MGSSVRPPAPDACSLANNARRWRRSQPRRQCAGDAPASVARQPVDFNGDGYEDVIASVPDGTVTRRQERTGHACSGRPRRGHEPGRRPALQGKPHGPGRQGQRLLRRGEPGCDAVGGPLWHLAGLRGRSRTTGMPADMRSIRRYERIAGAALAMRCPCSPSPPTAYSWDHDCAPSGADSAPRPVRRAARLS
ncbi:FG-GAP repeat protein [Streptomyces parvus]|uniref:FG-GAP repeat protein n=1 Tax=Streptomyces parvus TaxID=66428 RepID=UPI003641BD74